MSDFRTLLCCLALLVSLPGYAKQTVPDDRAEDESAIREMEIAGAKAVAEKDLDRLISLYADNAALYDASLPNISGKDAIRRTWEAIFDKPGFSMILNPMTVEISPDGVLAWTHGNYTMTMNDGAGKSVMDRGEYALVYKRQPDGKWKVVADNGNPDFRPHALPKPPKKRSPFAPLAPLIGLACFFSGLWFLFGMPVVVGVYFWKCFRKGKTFIGLPIAFIMLLVFWTSAILLYRYIAPQYWNLSFPTALKAAGDAARYGHPVEHTAQSIMVTLLTASTFSAVAAGIILVAARYVWSRLRRSTVWG